MLCAHKPITFISQQTVAYSYVQMVIMQTSPMATVWNALEDVLFVMDQPT
jgi:hypothetical protein